MAMIVIDLPPERLSFDESRFPDRDTTHIYEHLLHYCSLVPQSDPLPVIDIRVESGSIIVTRGHKYLKIAKQLGRRTVRATIHTTDPLYDADVVADLLAQPYTKQVDWQAILKREEKVSVKQGWQVFFFERALQSDEKHAFEDQVAGFFPPLLMRLKPDWDKQPIVGRVEFDDVRRLAQFQAWIPIGVESWFGSYFYEISLFDQQHVHIVSYQGRRYFRGPQNAP